MDYRHEILKNMMFQRQIIENLLILDNKERKTPEDRKNIIREHNQLISQLDIILVLFKLYDDRFSFHPSPEMDDDHDF